jgi:[protein-PII] uridylyltransferase
VAALVARVQARIGGGPMAEHEPLLHPTLPQVSVAPLDVPGATGAVTVGIADVADGQQVTIGAPDRPGLLSTCAGVLALNQLDVRAAKMSVEDGYGTGVFAVRPRFGRAPVPEILADAVRAALDGTLPLADRLRQREADYREDGVLSAPPRISWHNAEVSGAATGIVEVRAGDRAGLLYRLTAAITGEGLDVTSARIETLGADAVDSFYVCNPSGQPVDAEQRERVDAALAAVTRGVAVPGELSRADTPG